MDAKKPISILREEFINSLAALINASKLPAYVIEPILKDVLVEVQAIENRQLEIDRANYEQALMMAQEQVEEPETIPVVVENTENE